MSENSEYECTLCGFKLPAGRPGHFYVANDAGERMPCARHDESGTIARVLGIDEEVISSCSWNPASRQAPVDLMEERIGYLSPCVCLDCMAAFGLDLKRDPRRCPACGSARVKTELEMIDEPCPRCGEGRIYPSSVEKPLPA
jgi:DNA-directed RNA polymerase subunit RPC12/RpoP